VSPELLKVIVRAVMLERDEHGQIVGERLSDPAVAYTPEQLAELVATLCTQLVSSQSDQEVTHAG